MDPIIEKAEEQLELLSSEDYVRELAEAREAAMRDWNSSLSGSMAEGRAKGRAEGKAEAQREMVLRLLAKGLDVLFISEVCGLSIEEIEHLSEASVSREEG